MDVRLRFKKLRRITQTKPVSFVIRFSGLSIGLIVDCVSEVLTIPMRISPKAAISSKSSRGMSKISEKSAIRLLYD
jgi:chemotaxis signal transduction protein